MTAFNPSTATLNPKNRGFNHAGEACSQVPSNSAVVLAAQHSQECCVQSLGHQASENPCLGIFSHSPLVAYPGDPKP